MALMGKVTSTHDGVKYDWRVENCNSNGDCKNYTKQPGNSKKEFVIFPPGFFEGKEHESHESKA